MAPDPVGGTNRTVRRGALAAAFAPALLLLLLAAAPATAIEISVQTTECNGDIGFSTFTSGSLYKIQSGDCKDPNTGEEIQQVLLHTSQGGLGYSVLWVTQSEARNIMAQIRDVNNRRLQRIDQPTIRIEREVTVREQAAPAAAPRAPAAAPSAPVAQEEMPAPTISLFDPPISNTRSVTRVIASPDSESRLVVGRIDAPAGLLSLSVNGVQQEVDERGNFKSNIPVKGGETPVTLLAVDAQGKKSTVEFSLVTQTPDKGAAGGGAGGGDFGTYHAIVIANSDYEGLTDLRTPLNDAEEVSKVLKERYGFKVTRLNNATRYQTLSALNTARRELTDKDNLLIYYAGHGEYDKTSNRGHWLPVDAESDSTANWISTVAITDIINNMSARHVLVIADSCYSGALTRSTNIELDPKLSEDTRARWLQAIAGNRSRYVLSSGGLQPVLDDDGSGHSLFANALLGVLKANDGIMESSKMFREVRDRVEIRAQELGVEDSPQYGKLKNTGHEFGEFLLVGKAPE